nr:phage baseplate assembly protein V [Pseudanabaena sp. FACHB-2040]
MTANRAKQNNSSNGVVSLHFGRISAIDSAKCTARVNVAELGMESYWLPVLQFRAGANQAYWMPSVGELVCCLLDEKGEGGAILGGCYSEADPPPASSANQLHILTGKVVIKGDVDLTGTLKISGSGNAINGKQMAVIGAADNAGHSIVSSGQ